MLKKLAYAVIMGGLLSGVAFADTSFPKDNSRDYAVPVGTSDSNSPFPRDNSLDYGIVASIPAGDSPFPKDNSKDYAAPLYDVA